MADGVTTIGDGWGIAVPGTAEAALQRLLAAGHLSGDALCQELIAEGHESRGPAYYPKDSRGGPFYALGNPHTYCSIEQGPNGLQWNLTDDTGGVPIPITGQAGTPTPAPTPAPADDTATLAAAVANVLATGGYATRDDVSAAADRVIATVRDAQQAIQQQIDQAIKNAEASAARLLPIVEAALPALSGMLGK